MSLTFSQMQSILHEIIPLLEGSRFSHCTTIQPRKFLLHFENEKQLLICLQHPFLRFHMTQHPWKEMAHGFSKQVTQYLHHWQLNKCELLNEDRILMLSFSKGTEVQYLVCELIPKRANAYLLNSHHTILAALIPVEQTSYTLPPVQSQPEQTSTEPISSAAIEISYLEKEKESDFSEAKNHVEAQLKQHLKHAVKAQNKFSIELEAAHRWEDLQHEASLLQANLYKVEKNASEVIVNDWLKDNTEIKILLDPTLSAAEQVAHKFQKSRKLKKAIEPLQRQLEQSRKNQEKFTSLLVQLQEIQSEKELKHFCQKHYLTPAIHTPKKVEKQAPALPYREFFTQRGMQLWVGKNAEDNDKLTFTHANGSDYWLHASGVPGSHIVLRLGKHREPDEESLKDAIHAALYYSKAKDRGEGEVSITQCKYVSKYGKVAGKVQISHHRNAYAKIDHERLKRLRLQKPQ